MANPFYKIKRSNWIQILATILTLFPKIESIPLTHEEFYIFPRIYLKFSFELGSNDPTELEIIQGYETASKSQLSIDPDVYNHIRKYKFHANAAISPENDEQRIQEINKIHELCHVALEAANQIPAFFRCPSDDLIYPCTCTELEQSLNCSDVNSFIDLKKLLNDKSSQFPTTKFDKFTYYPASPSIGERTLLNNTFGSLSFVRMMIGDSGLIKVEADALSGSESTLEVLAFDNNNNLQQVPFQQILNNFPQLSSLIVIKGSISEVPRLKSTALTLLDLNNNLISALEYDTFQYLPLLTTLDIGYNEIETIGPQGWFLGTNTNIYIDHNSLTSVSAFASYQPSVFDANNNKLTSFSQAVFEPILKKKYFVNVESNDISCTSMVWATGDPDYSNFLSSDCYK